MKLKLKLQYFGQLMQRANSLNLHYHYFFIDCHFLMFFMLNAYLIHFYLSFLRHAVTYRISSDAHLSIKIWILKRRSTLHYYLWHKVSLSHNSFYCQVSFLLSSSQSLSFSLSTPLFFSSPSINKVIRPTCHTTTLWLSLPPLHFQQLHYFPFNAKCSILKLLFSISLIYSSQ